MNYLKVGEYATALSDAPYFITSDGWTGLVKGSSIGKFSRKLSVEIRGTDGRRSQEHIHTFSVSEHFFIPYSLNLETAGFLKFIKWKGDE